MNIPEFQLGLLKPLHKEFEEAGYQANLITLGWAPFGFEQRERKQEDFHLIRVFAKKRPVWVDISVIKDSFCIDGGLKIETVANPNVNKVVIEWFKNTIEDDFMKRC